MPAAANVDLEPLEQWLPLVARIALAIHVRLPKSVDLKDLEQDGFVGLMDAAKSFDASRGVKFDTFATPRIHGAIIDALRLQDYASRSSRQRGDAPAVYSLSASVSVNFDEGSIETTLGNQIADRRPPVEEMVDNRDLIDRLFTGLPAIDRKAMRMFFLDGMPMQDVADACGVTESRISQRIDAAKVLLRAKGAELGIESSGPAPKRNVRRGTSLLRKRRTLD